MENEKGLMKEMRKKLNEIIYISRVTQVTKKRLRIIFSVILSNTTVILDILIILYFAYIITGETTENTYIIFFVEKIYLLPLIILFRYASNFIEKMNIISLQLQVEKNLRVYLIKEVYKKGNYSIADATFYINTLSGHVGFFYGAFTAFLNSTVQIIIYSAFLLTTSTEIILIFAGGGLVLFFPTRKLLRLGRKYMHESWINAQQTGRDVQRVVENIFLIKILGTSESEISRYEKTTQLLQDSQLKNQAYGITNSLMPNFITVFTISILFIFTNLTKVVTLEFLGVTLRLVQTVGALNTSLNMMINSQIHLSKFIELENNKLIERSEYYLVEKNLSQSIELSGIDFKYFRSDEYIFEDLNINFYKNKHTVITGPNGSGKSTLLGIISKIFYPEKGSVKINSNKIGYVGVTPLIINSTLRENFLYGNEAIKSDEEIEKLMKEFELFNEDEKGLDTVVDSKSLSSGQMQKISFIRSLLADTELLLLDESTSNLDTETKDLIFKILEEKAITIINSTHNKDDFKYDYHVNISYSNGKRNIDYL
ncbi:ABC transporter ATP-binding protein/permease [Acidimicrobiia bacterium]|nr:ABC transporter ATP-binding protein/permease [Acidimicrobiia bacterium]